MTQNFNCRWLFSLQEDEEQDVEAVRKRNQKVILEYVYNNVFGEVIWMFFCWFLANVSPLACFSHVLNSFCLFLKQFSLSSMYGRRSR